MYPALHEQVLDPGPVLKHVWLQPPFDEAQLLITVHPLLPAFSEYPVLQLQVDVPGPVYVHIWLHPPFDDKQLLTAVQPLLSAFNV